ncbi:MAG: hypothetical protein PVG66_07715 [Chromatiales bacterium]|jgi:hypothetical protein
MFKVRKEIGLSELIAFGALVISGLAYWNSSHSDRAYIVQGGGTVQIATIKDEACSYVMAFPVEFHNSGKQAVSLEQLAPHKDIEAVLFSDGESILPAESIIYKTYLSSTAIGVIPSFWLKEIKNKEQFKPSFNHISDLIRPSHSYRFYVILLIDPYSQLKPYNNLSAHLTFDAVFSNGQSLPIATAVSVSTYDAKKCG